ncbi:molybdopterin molybdotransferase MoeA [Oleomonas cavernae]|uniref:molybdopterin molybdotransferase MoeA n=1 Tax=Oleomonas cavernae TaxID=2320859 RepID=UPI0026D5904F
MPLSAAAGRVLGRAIEARRTQPPLDLSAMDGWAVRAADAATAPVTLEIIGESAAGRGFDGTVAAGTAVRIFTGAPVPAGADAVVLQEDATRDGDRVTLAQAATLGRHIRRAGLDFQTGAVVIDAGRRLSVRDIALAAAADVPLVQVHRRPRIACLATGDELVRPGEARGPHQIVDAGSIALAALIERAGGIAIDLGIARDDPADLSAKAAGAAGADLLVTLGGASVGDHDLIAKVLAQDGADLDFWKIAMRPGKPLMFGRFGDVPLLGLPGNPVSSLIGALLFLLPAVARLSGLPGHGPATVEAVAAAAFAANDRRQDYIRATATHGQDGRLLVTPLPVQDSSQLSALARADVLVVRPPLAPAAAAGDILPAIPLDTF